MTTFANTKEISGISKKATIEAIIKKEKDTGNFVLFLPYQIEHYQGNFTSFTLNEGHNACCYGWYLTGTKPLTEQDLTSIKYQRLVNYYESEYDLKILKKINRTKQAKAIQDFRTNWRN